MKFVIGTAKFREAVGAAMKAASAGKLKPILTGVLLDATGDDLVVTGTDLDTTIRKTAGANVSESGSVVVPAKKLYDHLGTLTADTVEVRYDGNNAQVRSKGCKFDLLAWDAMEFPQPAPFNPDEPHRTVTGAALKGAINRVKHALDRKKETPRFAINCVRFELTASAVKVVVTDTYQLAYAECPCESVGGPVEMIDAKGVSMPPKMIDALAAFTDTDVIQLAANPMRMTMVSGGTLVTVRASEGRFPPYVQLLPRKQPLAIPLMVDEFEKKVRQVKMATDVESCRVDLKFEPGKCLLTARSTENGKCESELDITYDGAELAVALDPDYVLGFLGACRTAGAAEVRLEATDGMKPVVFVPLDGSESWNLIMTMGSRE